MVKNSLMATFNEKGEMVLYEETLDECYFCGFNLITHSHHIIRRIDGGSDRLNNLITLCPNHHYLIHSKKYILGYGAYGFMYLKERYGNDKIKPFKFDEAHKRKLPLTDLKYNKNLIIEGDINSKASIKIKREVKDGSSQ